MTINDSTILLFGGLITLVLVIQLAISGLHLLSFTQFRKHMKDSKQKKNSFRPEDDDSTIENVYKRLVELFEKESPYLNPNLTINDVASELYTNKTYVSKALSTHGETNFCQFVNGYRVRYAIDHFKQDPRQRVVEMAQGCGFRTVSSFTVAFRIIMDSSPGEWCNSYRLSSKN